MDLRNETGGISSHHSIPSSSYFREHGGRTTPCSYIARSAHTTSDGQSVEAGQRVYSDRWIFREGEPPSFGEPSPAPETSLGPLATATRSFLVFCDKYTAEHAVGYIRVTAYDPMFDPRDRLTELYNGLQLIRPELVPDPVVDRWGGLVTRYPTWLGIRPEGWTSVRSNVEHYRGWTLYLFAEPIAMDVHIDFDPDPERPSPPFDGYVPCIADGAPPSSDGVHLPAMPPMAELAEPGVNGPCQWTPPGPGTVTFEARIRYRVTLWADGYTELLPEYVWTSPPLTHRTGELTSVNLDPTRP